MRLQPQDLSLMSGATTHWTYTCSTHWGSNPKGSSFIHDFVMLVLQHYVCSVFILYHIQLIITYVFHKSSLNMHHSYHFLIYMFSCILINSSFNTHDVFTVPSHQFAVRTPVQTDALESWCFAGLYGHRCEHVLSVIGVCWGVWTFLRTLMSVWKLPLAV